MDKRKVLTATLAALILVFSASCGQTTPVSPSSASETSAPAEVKAESPTNTPLPAPTEAKTEEQITLNVWFITGNTTTLPEKLAQGFNAKYPNVKVEFSFYSFDDMNRSLRMALDGGTGPDVANASPGLTGTDAYARAGHLVDLTEIAKERGWDKHYSADLLTFANLFAPEKHVYGIPTTSSTVGVYYNPEIFDKYGLKVPETFDEFENILATLKADGVTPFSVGALDQWPLSHYWEQLIHLTTPFDELTRLFELDTTARFDSPTMIQAAAKLQEWAKKGYFAENYLATNFADGNSLFITGKVAMNVGGTWVAYDFTQQPEFKAHFFPMPPMNPNMPWHAGGQSPDNNWIVSKYSKHQDVAINFVDYVLSEEGALLNWNEGNIVTYKFDKQPPTITLLQGEIYAAMQKTGPGYYMGVTGEVLQAEGNLLQQLCAGDLTPEKAMEELQKVFLESIKNLGNP